MIDPLDEQELAVERKRLYGVYPATVTDVNDPDKQGRVRIALPWAPDADGYALWARLATMMGGNSRGTWFIPDVKDEVLVMFEAGDPRRPYVIGGLWNGTDQPPESMDGAGKNYKKSIVSRNNCRITLDDTDGKETITIQTPGGQKVTLKDGANSIELQDSNGNDIKMEPAGITISTPAKLTVSAGTVEVTAGTVTVNSAMSNFSGVVHSDTVLTNTVIGASYTPGAGNIW